MKRSGLNYHITRLRRSLLRRRIVRSLSKSLTVALGIGLVAVWTQQAGIFRVRFTLLLGLPLLAAFIVSALLVFLRRRPFLQELIRIDRQMSFHDLLSTAYDYSQRGPSHPGKSELFFTRLVDSANQQLAVLAPGQIIPLRLNRQLTLALLFTALLIMTLGFNFSPFLLSTLSTKEPVSSAETYAPHVDDQETLYDHMTPRDLDARARSLSDALRQSRTGRDRLQTELGRLADTLQKQQELLARQLAEDLEHEGLGDKSGQGILRSGTIDNEALKQLEDTIAEHLANEIPETMQQGLQDLDRIQKTIQYLEQSQAESDTSQEEGDRQDDSPSQTLAVSKDASDQKGDQPSGDRNPDGERPDDLHGVLMPADQQAPPALDKIAGRKRSTAPDQEQEALSDDDAAGGLAGKRTPEGIQKETAPIESAQGPQIKFRGEIGKGPRYKARVRAFPSAPDPVPLPAPVARRYRQEVEGVLSKEDIPLNYREYIKRYFLSIGLDTEESKNVSGRKP